MSDQHWIPIFIQQSSSVMILWNVYIVVVVGVIGFVLQKGAALSKSDRYTLIIVFLIFALSNGWPLYEAQSTLFQIWSCISFLVQPMFHATEPLIVSCVHALFDIFVIVFLYTWPNKQIHKDT
jgi:hypothetical protein